MKRILALMLALLLLMGGGALADMQSAGEEARAQADKLDEKERVVNVFTWTYYIPDEVVAAFEDASGIRVNYTPFSDNESMLSRVQSTPGQFDLIACSDYIIDIMRGSDLLAPLDRDALTNWGNIDPGCQSQYYDPDNEYTVPYTVTVPLIVYDTAAVSEPITGYADLWRDEFKGNLVLIDDMRNVIGMAEKKLGLSLNETDPSKLDQVRAELNALKDNVVVFNADTPHNTLIGGDAVAGLMFGSQIVAAQEEISTLEVVYPEEGLAFGIDCLVVPKDAPHMDAAQILINYLLDGEVSAWASALINYGSCNTAAAAYMSEEFKADKSVNVPSELLASAEMIRPLDGDAERLYDEIWTEFKN